MIKHLYLQYTNEEHNKHIVHKVLNQTNKKEK
jgi:hypothetical protein